MASTQHFQAAIGGNVSTTVKVWSDLVDDLAALRTAIKGVTAQLDADGGVTGTTFASGNDPAALKTKKAG